MCGVAYELEEDILMDVEEVVFMDYAAFYQGGVMSSYRMKYSIVDLQCETGEKLNA